MGLDFRGRSAEVVIAGGGVAAVEAMIALYELAPVRVHVTLVAPGPEIVLRPAEVTAPFRLGRPTRHPLAELAAEFGAALVAGTVAAVDAERRRALLAGGEELRYDSLIVATGARAEPAYEHAVTIGADGAATAVDAMLAALERDGLRRIAFVVPPGCGWTLPVHELALLTAAEARRRGVDDARILIVSAEERPLALFGTAAAASVEALLEDHAIEFEGASRAEVTRELVVTWPRGLMFAAERTLALPLLRGPSLPGLARDRDGFLPADAHGRVRGAAGVFAAGDVTSFPVKQGGLAAQQAEAAAQAVAARHGCALSPRPFRPVLRGRLVTAAGDLFLSRAIAGGGGDGRIARRSAWVPPAKLAAPRLSRYLAGRPEVGDLLVERESAFHGAVGP
jgi:sulfide:quinone oxidoreductase